MVDIDTKGSRKDSRLFEVMTSAYVAIGLILSLQEQEITT